MTSPYVNTKLSTNLLLHPIQMNNNIYLNLKEKLKKKLENRCFGEYGYIMKVFQLLDYKNGTIEAENTSAAALFDAVFSCRLCRPLNGSTIVCEVESVNKVLLRLNNGPILIVVTNDRINNEVFFKDNYRNIRYKSDNKSYLLKKGDFVKVNIIQTTFHSGGENIMALGYLTDMAKDSDVENFYKDAYNNNTDKFIDYQSFIESKKKPVEEESAPEPED